MVVGFVKNMPYTVQTQQSLYIYIQHESNSDQQVRILNFLKQRRGHVKAKVLPCFF